MPASTLSKYYYNYINWTNHGTIHYVYTKYMIPARRTPRQAGKAGIRITHQKGDHQFQGHTA